MARILVEIYDGNDDEPGNTPKDLLEAFAVAWNKRPKALRGAWPGFNVLLINGEPVTAEWLERNYTQDGVYFYGNRSEEDLAAYAQSLAMASLLTPKG